MKRAFFFALPLCAVVAGCQSNYTYVPIVANPRQIEMAEAQCQMMSSSAERGMIAWGNPNYVAGAQLGNAIGNAIRVDQFMQQCMNLQGWKRVPKPEGATTVAATSAPRQLAYSPVTGKPMKGAGAFPPAPK